MHTVQALEVKRQKRAPESEKSPHGASRGIRRLMRGLSLLSVARACGRGACHLLLRLTLAASTRGAIDPSVVYTGPAENGILTAL